MHLPKNQDAVADNEIVMLTLRNEINLKLTLHPETPRYTYFACLVQGLAAAAATREAAKRKRDETQSTAAEAPAAKRPQAQPQQQAAGTVPVLSHEVIVPEGFREEEQGLDKAKHGAQPCTLQRNRDFYNEASEAEPQRSAISLWRQSLEGQRADAGTLQNPIWTGPMAKEYPFTLDPFQSTAVACLVRCRPLQ